MAKLEIALLGPLQVRLAGNLVTPLPIRKALALLTYLAVEAANPHARERLAAMFWPDQPKDLTLKSLRQTLFVLRQTLSPDFLLSTRLDVQFNRQADHHLDVAAFRELVTACQRHLHSRPDACPDCIARLQQAVALYRGDFLQHFALPDSEPFEEWVMLKREWLQRAALDALFHLAEHYTRQADYEPARQYAWRQVELDPPREEAHRQLMRALALSGRRTEALEQYEICRRILVDAVAAEPAQETTALYEQIRRDDLRPARDDLRPTQSSELIIHRSSPSSDPIPHNLPAQLAPLIGRKAERDEMLALLADPAVRLVTLLGVGGIGKTHLALAIVAEQLAHFPDGVYFVELAPLSSPVTLVTAIAEALKLPLATGNDPRQQLCAYLHPKRLLLLLDNFEHLLAGVDLVVALLHAAPSLKIVTTSRTRLHLQSEQLFPLNGLDFPTVEQTTPALIGGYGAIQLFLQQARRTQLHYAPAPDDWPAIAQICRLLEGMPLGILLAAAWLEFYTPTEIATQLGQNLDFLASDWQDMPARHKSMRAVFDHSWHLLTAGQRVIFQQLSVFRGGFTYAAAQVVTGATPRDLMALVDRSLVRHTAGSSSTGRFGLHELVRQFAADKLEEDANASSAARDRHAEFFAAFLQQQHAHMGKPQQATALAAVDVEIENVRVAWDRAVRKGQVHLLQQALRGMIHYYTTRGHLQAGEKASKTAAEKLEQLIATMSDPPIDWLKLLWRLIAYHGVYRWMREDFADAERLLKHSLTVLDQLETAGQEIRKDRGYVFRELGRIAMRSDRVAARHLFEESLALYRAVNEPWGISTVLAYLGEIELHLGGLEAARRWLEEGFIVQQVLQDLQPRASLYLLLGIVSLQQGRLTEAEQLLRTALDIAQLIGQSLNDEQLHLGIALVRSGRFVDGCLLLETRIREDDVERLRSSLGSAYCRLGEAYLHSGNYQQASKGIATGLEMIYKLNEPCELGEALQLSGQLAMVAGETVAAHSQLLQSTQILRKIKQKEALGWSLACLGYVERARSNPEQARQSLAEAVQIAVETGAVFPFLVALPAFALLALDQEEPVRAVELYALATQHPFVANSHWFAEVAGCHMAAVAAQLPADVAQAAQAQGRTADLWQTARHLLQEIGA